jgi:hypothetical protein
LPPRAIRAHTGASEYAQGTFVGSGLIHGQSAQTDLLHPILILIERLDAFDFFAGISPTGAMISAFPADRPLHAGGTTCAA